MDIDPSAKMQICIFLSSSGSGMTLTITIPGIARGKQRARFGNGRTYTPQATVNAEAWVKACTVQQVGAPCLEGPLRLAMEITVPVPASWPKKRQADERRLELHEMLEEVA